MTAADPTTPAAVEVTVRRARTADVRDIRRLVDAYTADGRLLAKSHLALYEDVPEFQVATVSTAAAPQSVPQADGAVVGCGAVHVLWEDLAEIRTVAVDPAMRGHHIGHALVSSLLDTARVLGVRRVFVLTFETRFFGSFGFTEIQGTPVPHDVYEQLLRSYDEGVAEFLDLDRVKPNTLGNVRMLLHLD
jgi:amino-acid N-acetyltransferase